MTLRESVIRPERAIARASAKGNRRTSSSSVPSGVLGLGDIHVAHFVGNRVREMDAREKVPSPGHEPGFLA